MRSTVICTCLITTVACASDGAKQRYFENGRQFLSAGKAGDAVRELRIAVDMDERWGAARLLLADAYAANGEPELAHKQFVRAADLMPDDAPAQIKAATSLLQRRQFSNARARVERFLQISPANVEAQIILAKALVGLRDVDGAEARLEAVIATEPRSEAYTTLASVYTSRGRVDEAAAAYDKALEIDPGSIEVYLALASFQSTRGDPVAAEATLQRALSINPTDLLLRRALVSFYTSSGRQAAAEQHLRFLAETTNDVVDRLSLADYYEEIGQLSDARRALEQLAGRKDVPAAVVETRLARLDDVQGNGGAATERLSAVLKNEPGSTAALVLHADWSARDRRWEDARAAANAAIAANPRMVSAYRLRAEADLRTHRNGEAIAAYTKMLRLDRADAGAAVALSRLQLSQYAVDSAVMYAEEAVKRAPDDLAARLALVRAWMARGDDSFARTELDRLITNRTSAELFTLDGLSRLKQGDIPAARAALDRALAIDVTSLEAVSTLTAMDVRARDFSAARRRVDRALAAAPDEPRLLLVSARLALAAGNRKLGETQLRRVIELDPLDLTAFTLLARLFQIERRLDAAIQEFDAVAQRNPSALAPRLMAALALDTAGDDASAEQRYRDILKSEPRAALAGKNLAVIYLRRGHALDDAEQLASAALQQRPADAELRDLLGSINLRLSRHGAAIQAFAQAVTIEPGNATFRYHLGDAYAQSGEREQAAEMFRHALRLNPDLTVARNALDSLTR